MNAFLSRLPCSPPGRYVQHANCGRPGETHKPGKGPSLGIYAVRATIHEEAATSGFHGAGSGRKAIWHTVQFITTLYHSLRQVRSLEALRMAYLNKLQGHAMQTDPCKDHTSIVLQYCFSFVPAWAPRPHPEKRHWKKLLAKNNGNY